jgi:hypothetical protein
MDEWDEVEEKAKAALSGVFKPAIDFRDFMSPDRTLRLVAELKQERERGEKLSDAAQALVRCHEDYVATTPHQKFPCRVDEMTEREFQIAQVAFECSGAFSFIGEEVDALRDALSTDVPTPRPSDGVEERK